MDTEDRAFQVFIALVSQYYQYSLSSKIGLKPDCYHKFSVEAFEALKQFEAVEKE